MPSNTAGGPHTPTRNNATTPISQRKNQSVRQASLLSFFNSPSTQRVKDNNENLSPSLNKTSSLIKQDTDELYDSDGMNAIDDGLLSALADDIENGKSTTNSMLEAGKKNNLLNRGQHQVSSSSIQSNAPLTEYTGRGNHLSRDQSQVSSNSICSNTPLFEQAEKLPKSSGHTYPNSLRRGLKRMQRLDSDDEQDTTTNGTNGRSNGDSMALGTESTKRFEQFINKKRQKLSKAKPQVLDSDDDYGACDDDDDADVDFKPGSDSEEEPLANINNKLTSKAGKRDIDDEDVLATSRFKSFALSKGLEAELSLSSMASRSLPSTPRKSRFKNLTVDSNGSSTPPRTPLIGSNANKKDGERRYPWLEDIQDIQGRRPGEPGYDKQTLYIPPEAWKKFTPFEKQFWDIKTKYWDSVVFFKKGKFFELYEKDADIAHKEFDLKMTDRVNMRMAGVPEMSFENWASQFIARGYKVAKVDQLETAIGKTMRERNDKKSKKEEKLIRRELTAVLTAGTLVDPRMLSHDLATYCMAIVESWPENTDSEESTTNGPNFGIAFVDTSTAQFWSCIINDDDEHRSLLETLLVQIHPREVIYVLGGANTSKRSLTKSTSAMSESTTVAWDGMGGLTPATWRALKNNCGPNTLWNGLKPRVDFWDYYTTKNELEAAKYFVDSEGNHKEMKDWPEPLIEAINNPLELCAIGGLISYLKSLKLDRELVSLGNFSNYKPIQEATSLILDGPTMSNLDLFSLSSESRAGNQASLTTLMSSQTTAAEEGTLFSLINHAITPFGKRLLRRWVCHPLRNIDSINERLDVVEAFINNPEISRLIEDSLRRIPDMERLLSRIHAGSCRVKDWINLLDCLDTITNFMQEMSKHPEVEKVGRLNTLLKSYPKELPRLLDKFRHGFDRIRAETEGIIVPSIGLDKEYDSVKETLSELDKWFANHLKEHREKYHSSEIVYRSIGKEINQLEFPLSIQPPKNYARLSANKKVHRYWSPGLVEKTKEHAEAVETENMVLREAQARVYAQFDRSYPIWMKAIQIVSEIDALRSLAHSSVSLGMPYCRPQFIDINKTNGSPSRTPSYLQFKDLRHPCVSLAASQSSRDFVPNDIILGQPPKEYENEQNDGATMVLLTGPNMGGKSTLLRQVCLGIILAQLGCYVPASQAIMTPVDRLFTRIGARDHLLSGQSTFMVELAETSTLLRHATPHSFVAVDELGRGTSTHDGEAVAFGVLHSIAARLGCLGIFSTHYGMLADGLGCVNHESKVGQKNQEILAASKASVEPHVRPMHMACAVNEQEHRVTFLYKLRSGIAPRSHGMNVAAMAGVPLEVVKNAEMVAEKFEHGLRNRLKNPKHAPGTQLSQSTDKLQYSNTMPLTLQSDFANLIRLSKMAKKQKESSSNDFKVSRSSALLDRIGGINALTQFNENQYWGCLVDHISKSIHNLDLQKVPQKH